MPRVLPAGIVFALLGAAPAPARGDEPENKAVKAVRTVEKLGGKVYWDKKGPGQPVTGVYLSYKNATDDDLKDFPALEHLSDLSVAGTGITDAGIKHLLGCKSLTRLTLDGARISDAGAKALAGHNKLNYLSLHLCPIGDEGAKALATSKTLTSITLSETPVTDEGVK